ncbi:MATE family efflux transporter [Pseudomonas sp. ICMP 8385]|uniref:MATE family efflux transporter n=1 Tax=Pseudomonas sp. ICMP 8385 TaxID=1718920 RepID=UPI001145C006|nr:MATE family efflux transporter [Pseudomonas sp. ICMP 8385]
MRQPASMPQDWWRLSKEINSQAMHTMLSFSALMVANAIDMVFIAHLGHEPLTAASLASPFMWLMNTIAMGIALAISVHVSKGQERGGGNTVIDVLLPGLLMGAAVYGVVLVGVGLNLEAVLGAMGAAPPVYEQSEGYLRTWLYGFIITLTFAISTAYLRGLSLFKTQAVVVAVVCLMNIVLDPLLMFGVGGFAGFGLVGSVYAAWLAQAGGALVCIYFGVRHTRVSGPGKLRVGQMLKAAGNISRLAWVTSSTATFWPISGIVATYLISKLGDAEVATMGVISKLQPLIMIPVWGVSAVTTVLLSKAFVQQRHDQVGMIFKSGYVLVLMWQTVVALPFIVFAQPVARFMLGGYDDALPFVVTYLMIIPITVFGRGMLYLAVHGLPAIERARTAMAVDALYVLVLHTGCYWLGYLFNDFNLALLMLLALNLLGGVLAVWVSQRARRTQQWPLETI